MKFLRTISGLAAIFIGLGFVLYFFSFLLYLVPYLGQVIASLNLPQILLSHLVLGIGLFILGIVMMAKRRSKVASIVVGVLLIVLTSAGFYCDSIDAVSDSNLAIEIAYMIIGVFVFLLAGILQKGNLKTKSEKALALKQAALVYPQQPVYQQPYPQQQTYQQPAAVPLYQAPVNGWTCPSCGNVNDPNGRFCRACGGQRPGSYQQPPVQPAPVTPTPEPVVTPQPMLSEPTPASEPEPLLSTPIASEPTPLMETPKPVEEKPADGWTCKLCQTKNAANSKFCKNCGSPKDVQ